MTPELFDFIKILSLNDKKTLSEKALKTSEECGELARVVLPFDNAYGTTHRFIEKNQILEETADVILTVLSIAYDLGYEHEDILDMVKEKAWYWQGLQQKEDEVKYPIPYEIHVTIKNPGDITKFKDVCQKIGVKPIVLDLENNAESVMIDYMTSSVFYGDNRGSYEKTNEIRDQLVLAGFTVLRKKIETVPWHPAAPRKKDIEPKMPINCYFESHINVIINKNRKGALEEFAKLKDAHLSRNFFKKLDDDFYVNMLTMRSYECCYEDFMNMVEDIKKSLTENDFKYDKVIIEFSIYDTKISHDFNWLK